jgi:hypothetical protein
VFGERVRDNPQLYRRIGVMSEHETVYGFMKGRDFVRMMGKLRGVQSLEKAVDRAIDLVDLADAQQRRLAGTIRPEQSRDAGCDVERHIAHGDDAAEPARDAVDANYRLCIHDHGVSRR